MVNTPEQSSHPALTCPCSCHGHGRNSGHPCDWDGGCGHLHTSQAPGARPSSACQLCPAPLAGRTWKPAHSGYRTCDTCLDKLRDALKDIPRRYLMLNPRPGASGEHGGRGAPGFGSRSPASDQIIVMRDRRSKSCEAGVDGVHYVWDPHADGTLLPGQYGPPAGAYVDKFEAWFGADGRPHREQERPPRSVPAVLAGLVGMVAEDRGMEGPTSRQVPDLAQWLDAQLDYISRQDWVTDVDQDIRELVAQLKPVTGEPGRKHIGHCPNVLDEGEHSRECKAKLYPPAYGDTIKCHACSREWPRPEWERLGSLIPRPPTKRGQHGLRLRNAG